MSAIWIRASLLLGLLAGQLLGGASAQGQPEAIVGDPPEKVYATGRVAPPDLEERKVRSAQRNSYFQFPTASAATFSWEQLGVVPPVVNQRDCGSCWDFAGCGCCTMAAIKNGHGKADGSFRLSEQYVLDCGRNGGCNGDDHSSVFEMAISKGLPTTADYAEYQARPAKCRPAPHLLKFRGWGYCDPDARGPASVQSIKDAMAAKGPISVAIAADSAFMRIRDAGVFKGSGSRQINHEVILTGWDDEKKAWRLRNSWGTGWADGGNCWIAYGANMVGTDAAWADIEAVPPPPPPPAPPGPPAPLPDPVVRILVAVMVCLFLGSIGTKIYAALRR